MADVLKLPGAPEKLEHAGQSLDLYEAMYTDLIDVIDKYKGQISFVATVGLLEMIKLQCFEKNKEE